MARTALKIRWTTTAADDLQSAHDFLAEQSQVQADKVIQRILSAIDVLERFPEMGRPGRVQGTRELVIKPFVVAYRIRNSEVHILSVLHAARKWPEKL